MIKIINNFLTNVELEYIANMVTDNQSMYADVPNKTDTYQNFYYRIDIEIPNSIKEKLLNSVHSVTTSRQVHLELNWINHIFKNSNLKDPFHMDKADIASILFLNDDFDGGELEWIDNENIIHKIEPKKNTLIIFYRKYQHRVLSVTNGNRFTHVSFYNFKNNSKPLI